MFFRTVVIFSIGYAIGACSGPLVSGDVGLSNGKSDEETVVAGQPTSLTIEKGDLGGTNLEIPDGALPEGSSVNAASADTPASFTANENVTAASSPVAITAVSSDGSEIEDLSAPMKIQLPVGGTELRLLGVEAVDANLCALLETISGGAFVWRRRAISLEDSKAVFESAKIGIFQLVYCGEEELIGFEDAADNELAGSASEAVVTLTVDGSVYDVGQTHYCAGLITEFGKDSDELSVLGYTRVAANGGTQSVDISLSPGEDLAAMDSAAEIGITLVFQQQEDGCDFSKAAEKSSVHGDLLLLYPTTAGDLADSNITGEIGSTTFPLETQNIVIGAPTDTALADPKDTSACVTFITFDDNSGGFSEQTLTMANGNINGDLSFAAYMIPNDSGSHDVQVYLNQDECFDNVETTLNFTNDQPYRVDFPDVSSEETLYLAPVNLTVSIPSIVSELYTHVCVSVFEQDSDIDPSSETFFEHSLAMMYAETGSETTYQLYLPYQDSEVYDMHYAALDGSDRCGTSSDLAQATPDRPLNADITVEVDSPY